MAADQRICFVSPWAYPLLCGQGSGVGGAERQFFLFGRGLARAGWRVSFITHTPPADLADLPTEFPAWHADFGYLGGSKARLPLAIAGLLRAMVRANAQYYVLKVPGHLLPVMALYCRPFRRRLVFWAQMTYDADPRELALVCAQGARAEGSRAGGRARALAAAHRLGIRLADIVVAQSLDQQHGFDLNYGIRAPVVRSICEPLAAAADVGGSLQTDVLWVGNAHPKKRPGVVLELARRMPGTSFAVAMNRSGRDAYERWEDAARSLANVRFLGQVPPLEMESWFGRARLLLNSSQREGFPNTFLQAWMNSVPVVSLQVDPDHVIRVHGLGLMPSAEALERAGGDDALLADSLVRPISELLRDEQRRRETGSRCVRYVEDNHAPKCVVPKLISALRAG
jgi:glycosyltransferase involved in cell wall biosynthesis